MKDILIIDDQPYLQELLSSELIDKGFKVVSVTDTQSVSCCLNDSKPDLVLLDLYLKGFQGFDLLKDIKTRYPGLPVIIVTAYDGFADDPRLDEADGYVLKNFDAFDRLKEKIDQILH
ncbi:response regulator [Thermodesulfobacteriota bacterium]